MITAVIVDDEVNNVNYLQGLIESNLSEVKIIGVASNVEDGIKLIKKLQPALAFLDIELHTETSFDLLSRIDKIDFSIIFTTAHERYALRAIKFAALDFLLKPVDANELKLAVNKAILHHNQKSIDDKMKVFLGNMNMQNKQSKIAISTSSSITVLEIKDIIYMQSDGPYTSIYSQNSEKILSSKHLKEYEELLTEFGFFRIHKSYMVNLTEIKQYSKSDGGYVIMSDGNRVDVSDKKKEELISKLSAQVIFVK